MIDQGKERLLKFMHCRFKLIASLVVKMTHLERSIIKDQNYTENEINVYKKQIYRHLDIQIDGQIDKQIDEQMFR